ncbi:MAG: PIN domain-containing protein [Anaerolinea sp.]|nr:PIN domain-containing protein [Anaerolinea sp.]
MRFWDASAVVPLLVEEAATSAMRAKYAEDVELAAWWGTVVECVSAIARRHRAGALAPDLAADALKRLRELARSWTEMAPSEAIRESAQRIVGSHDLRAADALQLAAALAAAEGRPPSLSFVSLDRRLNEAARREGFRVVELGT